MAVAVFFLHAPIDAGSFAYLLPLVGFAGGFLTAALIYILSYSRSEGLQPIKLVLMGIGSSMALSGLMIFIISSSDRQKYEFIAKWLAGNIWGTDWPYLSALAPWLVILIPYVLYKSGVLNLLALSDHVTVGVGVRLQRERLGLIIAAVALASAAVSVTGAIAFIGLMAPHIAKSLVGPRHQMYIPVALLLGGWLLTLADLIGHHIVGPDGVPAGIMVALIGAAIRF